MSLHYRTRGNSDPKGKPRVYFCCHEDDRTQYLEAISGELLQVSNCAVFWYDAAPDAQWELELGQMQLFVMPVTKRLLTSANRALDVEFRFAVAHHIPVLPLMQEGGLERLFNEKCGDLQFLDKNAMDPTAISYEDKLKKYLGSVLIGDETAQKIRKAFDAYIFLSYRKKDRKYAQELMRLIHKNDFCRDIAIWYDEFLTPGENFNDSIREALEKSELFALAVTPNLVNETNYVMTTEFPMARDARKPILPVVLVKTDENDLKQKYPGIPPCTDGHDDKAMTHALLKAVQGLAKQQNDSDPMHNYLIGLAYLGGVDVEVDHEKAVQLITDAAGTGLIEAMEQLVTMYRDGIGVERSIETATEWQKRLVTACENEFRQNGTPDSAGSWLDAMMELGSLYQRAGKWNDAKTQYENVISCCKKMSRPNIFSWQGRALRKHTSHYSYALQVQIEARFQIGWCLVGLQEVDEAYDRFDDANDGWADAVQDRTSVLGQARSYIGMGDMEMEDFGYARAKKEYLWALELLQELDREEKDENVTAFLVECQGKLSAACIKTGDIEEAEAYMIAACEISEQMLAQQRTARTITIMAQTHRWAGDLLLAKQRYDSAKKHYDLALEQLQSPEICDDRNRAALLVSIYSGLGAVPGATDAAIRNYELACSVGEKYGLPTDQYHRALEQLYREMGSLTAEKHHADAWIVPGKADVKLMNTCWHLMVMNLYSLRNWLNGANASMGQRKKVPDLPRKLERGVGSDEVTQQIRCWMEQILPMADAAIPNSKVFQERIDACRALELLSDQFYEMASAFPLEQGRIFREMAGWGYELIYRHCPFTDYAEKAERIRQDLNHEIC